MRSSCLADGEATRVTRVRDNGIIIIKMSGILVTQFPFFFSGLRFNNFFPVTTMSQPVHVI